MIITCPSCSARYVVDPVKIGPGGRTVKCAKCGHAWAQEPPPPEDDAAPLVEHPPEPAAEPAAEAAAPEPPPPPPPAAEPPPPEDDGDDTEDFDRDFRATFEAAMSRSGDEDEAPDGDGPAADEAPRAERRRRPRDSNLPAVPKRRNPWPARIAWLLLIVVVAGTVGGAVMYREKVVEVLPAAQQLYDMAGLKPQPVEERLGVRGVKYSYAKAGPNGENTVLNIEGELVNLSDVPGDVPNLRVLFLDDAGNVVKRWSFKAPEQRMLPGEIVKFSTQVDAPPASAKRIDVGFDVGDK